MVDEKVTNNTDSRDCNIEELVKDTKNKIDKLIVVKGEKMTRLSTVDSIMLSVMLPIFILNWSIVSIHPIFLNILVVIIGFSIAKIHYTAIKEINRLESEIEDLRCQRIELIIKHSTIILCKEMNRATKV